MPSKVCCKNCKHCVAAQTALFSMCKVRRIKIHPEVGFFAFCHHWSRKEPALPTIKSPVNNTTIEQQLDFGKVLVPSDN